MRIFCAVRHANDPFLFYGGLWSANFYPALRALGHEIIESQVDLAGTSAFMDIAGDFTPEETAIRARTTEQIVTELREAQRRAPTDLFLSYFYNAHFDPAGFAEVRGMGIPSINFYCNSIHQFDLVKDIAARVDFAWHAEKDARPQYLAAGANPVWAQMAADPEVYRPVSVATRKPSACFVGQRYADRDRWMAALVRAGVPIEIYGSGWGCGAESDQAGNHVEHQSEKNVLGRSRAPVGSWRSYLYAAHQNIRRNGVASGVMRSARQLSYRRETRSLARLLAANARGTVRPGGIAGVFSEHEVCLNFSNVWSDGRPGSRLIPHVRLRDFEAPMCRTCYLTGYTEEITEFYESGREIDTYRSPEELVDKTRFYLQHDTAAEKLRDAGYRRAVADHTWTRRFAELFRKTGLAK